VAPVAETIRDAYLARKDDDVNILCLSGRTTSLDKSKKIIKKFLETEFNTKEEKYQRRINEIKKMEK